MTALSWTALLAFIALVLLAKFDLIGFIRRRRIGSRPVTAIGALDAESTVTVVGQVRHSGFRLVAPLTGEQCTCYSLTIDDLGSEQGGRLIDETLGVPFVIQDLTGTVSVDPPLLRIVARQRTVEERKIGGQAEAPPTLLRYLEHAADRGLYQGVLAMVQSGWPLRVCQVAITENAHVTIQGYTSLRKTTANNSELFLTCPDDGPLIVVLAP